MTIGLAFQELSDKRPDTLTASIVYSLFEYTKIALIGPVVNASLVMQGIYYGQAPYLISPLMRFQNVTQGYSINISFAFDCEINSTDQCGFAEASELARLSDVVIFIGGINKNIEDEGRDRTTIVLPDTQLVLLKQLENAVHSPLRVAMISGVGLNLTYIRDSDQFSSLIWMGYPGQSGGLVLATVMFGQLNPAGRLTATHYPASYVDEVFMADMQMRPSPTNPGRTYKFFTGKAVYEFGYGLSYTTFNYIWYNDSIDAIVSIRKLIKNKSNEKKVLLYSYRVNVTNTGTVAGDDVVLAYITTPCKLVNDPSPPIKALFVFQRVRLDVGQTTQVFSPLNIQSLLTVGLDGSKWLEPSSIQNSYQTTTYVYYSFTRKTNSMVKILTFT